MDAAIHQQPASPLLRNPVVRPCKKLPSRNEGTYICHQQSIPSSAFSPRRKGVQNAKKQCIRVFSREQLPHSQIDSCGVVWKIRLYAAAQCDQTVKLGFSRWHYEVPESTARYKRLRTIDDTSTRIFVIDPWTYEVQAEVLGTAHPWPTVIAPSKLIYSHLVSCTQ
jgi:hypothetical protein